MGEYINLIAGVLDLGSQIIWILIFIHLWRERRDRQ